MRVAERIGGNSNGASSGMGMVQGGQPSIPYVQILMVR